MENLISIKSQFNLINLGYTKRSYITKLVLIKSKIIILLSTNDLIIYDTSSNLEPPNNKINKHFIEEIQLIKSFQEKLFILQNKLITQLDLTNLDALQKYDLKEKPYLISFKDTKKNFIIFYVNEIHEILYMNSYFFTEIKRLYKESEPIIEMILSTRSTLLTKLPILPDSSIKKPLQLVSLHISKSLNLSPIAILLLISIFKSNAAL